MTRARSGVYVWVTWLSKLMAGEANCQWSAWFRSHYTGYTKAPGDFQLATWTVEHTQLLDELTKERSALGETIYKESQNDFRATRPSGLAIAGRPDLISVEPDSGHCIVYDTKTGSPRQSDIIQVALYMMLLPYATPLYKGKKLDGCVVYKTNRSPVPHQIIDDKFQKNVTYFLNILESSTPPEKLPTHVGCRFCDITSEDCPERVSLEEPTLSAEDQGFPL